MKLLKKLLKSNSGLSLVEVVCAVAILSIVVGAIGGAMVVSAKNYQKGTMELEVQQEAQMTTGMIANLLVDAAEVSWDEPAKMLTIKGQDVTYTVAHKADNTLEYTETVTGMSTMSGCLAENVTDFDVDATKFASSKNVQIDLTITKNNKKYTASYNTTARNGEVSGGVGAVEYANIVVTDKVIIEPGQSFELPVKVMGMTAEQVGGLNWSISSGSSANFVSKNNSGAVIKAGDDATGTFVVTVETGHKAKDPETGIETSDPLDRKQVVFTVRRVTGINLTANCSGTDGEANAVYTIKADVTGTELDRGIGKGFDMDIYEYKNPRYVDFKISMTGMESGKSLSDYISNEVYSEDTTSPSVQFKLKTALPSGSKITVTATAKHPEGEMDGTYYNKASVLTNSDDPYTPSVVETYEISKGTTDALVIKDGAILRGKKFVDFNDNMMITNPTIATSGAKVALINKTSNGTGYLADDQWYIRFRETGQGDDQWTQFIKLSETGLFPTLQMEETELFDPNKSYDLQFIIAFVDETNKKLMWPTDMGLLDTSKNYGFAEHGITPGWLDSTSADGYKYNYVGQCLYDPDSIGFSKYGGTYVLREVSTQFYDASGYEYGNNVYFVTPRGEYVNNVGSFSDPFEVKTNNRANLWFETSHMYRGSYYYDMIVEKYEGGHWVDVTNELSTYMQITGQKQNSFFMIEQFKTVGRYRIHIALTNTNSDGTQNVQARYRTIKKGDVLTKLELNDTPIAIETGAHFCGVDAYNNDVGYVYIDVEQP